jgi:folate-binding protein YgfZ
MIQYFRFQQDYLRFSGEDKLDLIHRLSTNDVKNLAQYGKLKTVLTSDKGRIIDVLILFNFGEYILAACSSENATKVQSHLEKYTILDDFKTQEITASYECFLFSGKDSRNKLTKIFKTELPVLTQDSFFLFRYNNSELIISENDYPEGIFIICSREDAKQLNTSLKTNDAEFYEMSIDEYENIRILNGIPAIRKEMTEDSNPLECGLQKYISFSKGCYIGQEVIARLNTYDKVSKHLIGLKSDSAFAPQWKIISGKNECGSVTSYSFSTECGHIGLGFIKTDYADFEKYFMITNSNKTVLCKLVKLPFH